MTAPAAAWDAVVLAGGAARRMGGVDKAQLDVGGRSLLEHVLEAVQGAERVVVVGPPRPTPVEVTWCEEDPPRSGPAAALGAALAHVRSPVLALLAADQPFVDGALVRRLVGAVGATGVVGVVADRAQWLCSAWPVAALRELPLEPGASLRRTLGALAWEPMPLPAAAALDCDTPEDLRRARELA
jgi:molybdopterin-guanine dinucleotide biosynthesis protein A